MLLLNFKESHLIDYVINSLAENLSTNHGIAIYIKNQLRLNEAFQVQVVDRLNAANASVITKIEENTISIMTFSGEHINLLSAEINSYKPSETEESLNDIIGRYKEFSKSQPLVSNVLIILTTGSYDYHQSKIIKETIENKTELKLTSVEFKFINNMPGVIFYSPVSANRKNNPEKKLTRRRIQLETNTYGEILSDIAKNMKNSNQIKTVGELMQEFEDDIKLKLEEKFKVEPNKAELVQENLEIFRSKNDAGARRSQILMRITNEKTRIHFSKNIKPDQNLFTYCEDYELKKVKFSKRLIKAYDLSDKSQMVYLTKN